MKKEEKQAQLELAKAMDKLAESINRFTDPVYIQKVFSDAFRGMVGTPVLGPMIAGALPIGVTIESVAVSLSDEERSKLVEQIYSKLKPQLVEFGEFTKKSLSEMPPHRLKELGDKIASGKEPKLRQRQGCIFIETDPGDVYYLGL